MIVVKWWRLAGSQDWNLICAVLGCRPFHPKSLDPRTRRQRWKIRRRCTTSSGLSPSFSANPPTRKQWWVTSKSWRIFAIFNSVIDHRVIKNADGSALGLFSGRRKWVETFFLFLRTFLSLTSRLAEWQIDIHCLVKNKRNIECWKLEAENMWKRNPELRLILDLDLRTCERMKSSGTIWEIESVMNDWTAKCKGPCLVSC